MTFLRAVVLSLVAFGQRAIDVLAGPACFSAFPFNVGRDGKIAGASAQ